MAAVVVVVVSDSAGIGASAGIETNVSSCTGVSVEAIIIAGSQASTGAITGPGIDASERGSAWTVAGNVRVGFTGLESSTGVTSGPTETMTASGIDASIGSSRLRLPTKETSETDFFLVADRIGISGILATTSANISAAFSAIAASF